MKEVLKYPLTPVPLALCHRDGVMQKTPKSKLLVRVSTRNPQSVDDVIMVYFLFAALITFANALA